MAYDGQNYKVNRKIKESVDKNQAYYEEEQSGEINIIKKVFVYVTDKKGHILNDVKITFDEKEFIIGKYGLLISQLPNEANTIKAEKEGYKSATANIILDAVKQTHEFYLALTSSEEDSEVISVDNTVDENESDERFPTKTILFEPPLDGTDEITSWSGINKTYDGIYEGHGSYLTTGWSNEGLWELECDVAYSGGGTTGYVGIMPICSEEINPFTDAKGKEYALSAWEGQALVTGLNLTAVGPINYKYSGREYYHHLVIKKVNDTKLEYYFDDNVWYITAPNLANLETLHIGVRDNPADRRSGFNILYKNIKVWSLNEEEPEFTPTLYYFKSYSDNEGTELWGTGTVETTGVEENGYSQVEIKTNDTVESFIGQKVFVASNANPDATTLYPLYSDAGTTAMNIYVKISSTAFAEETPGE